PRRTSARSEPTVAQVTPPRQRQRRLTLTRVQARPSLHPGATISEQMQHHARARSAGVHLENVWMQASHGFRIPRLRSSYTFLALDRRGRQSSFNALTPKSTPTSALTRTTWPFLTTRRYARGSGRMSRPTIL